MFCCFSFWQEISDWRRVWDEPLADSCVEDYDRDVKSHLTVAWYGQAATNVDAGPLFAACYTKRGVQAATMSHVPLCSCAPSRCFGKDSRGVLAKELRPKVFVGVHCGSNSGRDTGIRWARRLKI